MSKLVAENLYFSYGSQSVLEEISLEFMPGTLTALVGTNGAGKSTLLRLLQGQYSPDKGNVLIDGEPLTTCRRKVALMPQRSSINWNFPITVEGLVSLGELCVGHPTCCEPACCETEASLQRVGLTNMAKRRLDSLSGGQQQRALLARTLAQNASIFLLDEPCAALDPPSREQFLVLVRQLSNAGLTLVVTSHDWGSSLDTYDQVIAIDKTVLAWGSPSEVRTKLQSISSMGIHCCD